MHSYSERKKIIEIDRVEKTYANGSMVFKALNGVSFDIREGEFVAIMGPSGSGKSTLMNILGCLDGLNQGEYRLDGIPVSTLSQDDLARVRNQKIGFVFQSFNLLPKLKAWENVALPLVYMGIPVSERKAKAKLALEAVGLGDKMNNRPNELSGGQRQRVAIARAIAGEPEMIMADEPTGNLDSTSEEEILEIFRKLNREGATIVMVTHEPEVGNNCGRILRFRDGQLIKDEVRDHEFYRNV